MVKINKTFKRKKEVKIEFYRRPNKKGYFKTKARFVKREKQYIKPKAHGILHKVQRIKEERIIGDVPSLRKVIWSKTPKTIVGSVLNSTAKTFYRAGNFAGRTLWGVALTSENIFLGMNRAVGRSLKSGLDELVWKVGYAGRDDTSRAAAKIGSSLYTINRAQRDVRYLHSQRKLLKPKKNELKSLHKTAKFERRQAGAEHHKVKKDYKSNIKNFRKNIKNKNLKLSKPLNKHLVKLTKHQNKVSRLDFKKSKTKLKYIARKRKTDRKMFKMTKYGYGNEIIRTGGYKLANKISQSAGDNDFVTGAATVANAARILKPTNAQKLRSLQGKSNKLKKRFSNNNNKLHKKGETLKSKGDILKNKGKQSIKRNSKKAAKQTFKKIFSNPQNLLKLATNGVAKYLIPLLVPIFVIALGIYLIFQMLTGGGAVILHQIGSYNSDVFSLTQSSEYYLRNAWTMNERIRYIKTDYHTALTALGVNTSNYKEIDNYYWGVSEKFPTAPVYNYDPYKLWSYITAYYADFSDNDNDNQKGVWIYDNNIENLITSLFNSQYAFRHVYEEIDNWQTLTPPYYNQPTDPTSFWDGTEGWIMDERYIPAGKTGWYAVSYTETITDTVTETKQVTNPDYTAKQQQISAKQEQINNYDDRAGSSGLQQLKDQLAQLKSELDDIPPTIPKTTTKTEITEVTNYYFEQREIWSPIINLYYTVEQVQSLESAIINSLTALDSYTEDRLEYYRFLSGQDDTKLFGGHQSLQSPLKLDMQELFSAGRVFHYNGLEMTNWGDNHCEICDNGYSHNGIDISASYGEEIYAVCDGVIKDINGSNFRIYADPFPQGHPRTLDLVNINNLEKNSEFKSILPNYTGSVHYANVKLDNGVTAGTEVKKGQKIGTVNAAHYCGNIGAIYYLHLSINCTADYTGLVPNGFPYSYSNRLGNVDPILLIN